MTAADDETDAGVNGGGLIELASVDVCLDVIDADERELPGPGEGFGGSDADHERPWESRFGCDRDGGEIAWLDGGFGEDLFDEGKDRFEVGSSGDFGDNAAEAIVEGFLASDGGSDDGAIIAEDGGRAFIAGRLEREEEACRHS